MTFLVSHNSSLTREKRLLASSPPRVRRGVTSEGAPDFPTSSRARDPRDARAYPKPICILAAHMTATTEHARAPVAADETPAPKRITIRVKVTHAVSDHVSMDHLTHYREVDILADGSDTLAEVKRRFAANEGIDVAVVRFMWLDQTLGRNHVDDDSARALEEEGKTLEGLNVMFWLRKFPHWHLVATFVEQKPMGALERVHRTVAVVNKGFKDGSSKLDRYINTKRKQKTWNTLVYGAPTPHDARYPETMPDA